MMVRLGHSLTLLSSAARTASGTAEAPEQLLSRYGLALLLLDVTAAAAALTDTLDVYVQKNVGTDAVPVWTDFVHFTQVLGNGGPKQHVAEVLADTVTTALYPVQDGALAAGVQHGPWSNRWRIKWTISGGTASFTFSVLAFLI